MQPTPETEPAVHSALYVQTQQAAAAVVAAWQPRVGLVGYALCHEGMLQLTFLFATAADEMAAEEMGYYASIRLAVQEQLLHQGNSLPTINSVYIGFACQTVI